MRCTYSELPQGYTNTRRGLSYVCQIPRHLKEFIGRTYQLSWAASTDPHIVLCTTVHTEVTKKEGRRHETKMADERPHDDGIGLIDGRILAAWPLILRPSGMSPIGLARVLLDILYEKIASDEPTHMPPFILFYCDHPAGHAMSHPFCCLAFISPRWNPATSV